MKKKGQTVSLDFIIVIGLILFIVIFLVSYQVSGLNSGELTKKKDREGITQKLEEVQVGLREDKIIKEDGSLDVENFKALEIKKLQEKYGLKDFAIFFEKDGKLIKIDQNKNCYGSGNFSVNGEICN